MITRIATALFLAIVCSNSIQTAYSKPMLSEKLATYVVTSGREGVKEKAYLITNNYRLRVTQSISDGVLIDIDSGFHQIPNHFILKTSKKYADRAVLSIPMCAKYDQLTRYQSLVGVRTVHQFSEVPCENYSLPPNITHGRIAYNSGYYPWGKPYSDPTGKEKLNQIRQNYLGEDTTSNSSTQIKDLKSKNYYGKLDNKIKRIIDIGVNDLKICKDTGHCALESAYYFVVNKESNIVKEKIHSGDWSLIKELFSEDYYAYKEKGLSALGDFWIKLDRLPNRPGLNMQDVIAVLLVKPKLDLTRWQEAFKYQGKSIYVDRSTIQKKVLPMRGNGPPAEYTVWTTSANMFGYSSEPKRYVVTCTTIGQHRPNSPEELIHNWFCNSPDAMNTMSLHEQMAQQNKLQAQQAAQQHNQIIQDMNTQQAIQRGKGLINQFLPLLW